MHLISIWDRIFFFGCLFIQCTIWAVCGVWSIKRCGIFSTSIYYSHRLFFFKSCILFIYWLLLIVKLSLRNANTQVRFRFVIFCNSFFSKFTNFLEKCVCITWFTSDYVFETFFFRFSENKPTQLTHVICFSVVISFQRQSPICGEWIWSVECLKFSKSHDTMAKREENKFRHSTIWSN